MLYRVRDKRIVPKVWGQEEWHYNGPNLCGKTLLIIPGWRCSTHMHPIKEEVFHIAKGSCVLEIDGMQTLAIEGQTFHIPAGIYHWFGVPSPSDQPCEIFEFSTHHDDADVVRREESGPFKHSTTDLIKRIETSYLL